MGIRLQQKYGTMAQYQALVTELPILCGKIWGMVMSLVHLFVLGFP